MPHRLDLAVVKTLVTDRSLIALCLMYFTQAYGFYFNLTWLPTYLKKVHGYSGILLGLLAGLPLILSSLADVVGGLTTDRVTRAYGLRIGRCGIGGVALVVAGVSIIAGATTRHPLASVLWITLSGAAASFLLGSCWGVCLDVGGPHAGLVAASMNTAGQVGGFLSPIILPYFADRGTPLIIAGVLYLFGALCWFFVDPQRPIQFGSREQLADDLEEMVS
jgi:MFS family permease